MSTPYLVITLVENGWTIAVNGVLYPRTYVERTPEGVTERLKEILPDLVRRRYELSVVKPATAPKEEPS